MILVTLVVAALVAGCSGTPAGVSPPVDSVRVSPTAASPVSPTPSPRVSRAALTVEQAARRYLGIVRPYNVALERLEQAINGGRPVAELRRRAAQVATANEAHIRRLTGTPWPAAVRGPTRRLTAESGRAQRHWLMAARAQSRDALVQQVLNAVRHDGKAPAAKIRALLHLERYDEDDYA
ncbi:hypothetical protein ACIBP6_14110 [Nonomuraea terrae]|uniref:hypothetical protein n=1 Tax=Nonomuraea terrae TaxID=2530383 RepID=UPI0037A728BC